MPIDKVWIYRLLFMCVCVCVCLFVRIRISPLMIKLSPSNFAWRFPGVQGRESPILGNFSPQKLPQKAKMGRIALVARAMAARRAYVAQATWACPRRIGMCGYTAVLEDGRTFRLFFGLSRNFHASSWPA